MLGFLLKDFSQDSSNSCSLFKNASQTQKELLKTSKRHISILRKEDNTLAQVILRKHSSMLETLLLSSLQSYQIALRWLASYLKLERLHSYFQIQLQRSQRLALQSFGTESKLLEILAMESHIGSKKTISILVK